MKEESKYSGAMRYAGLGMQWMVMLGVAVWVGYNLDFRWIGWKIPLFLVVLPLMALGVSLWQLIRELNKRK
ncbi:MAG TPA: hypothetical protein PL009_02420 [Flavipsychrobacter sp.]|nr:hypothetical protein [Flavipsychrobacter sp.]